MAYLARTGFAQVMEYRAYIVGEDGHFASYRAFVCTDDSEAITMAKQLVDGHDVELWQRDRKIATFEHNPKMQF
jgi:hypothetical protein